MNATTNDGLPLGHRYLLHEVIGRGAMGEVRRATARDTGEEFAAKVLRPELAADEDVVSRFLQERRILMRISSPNVVAVRDLVVEADTLAIVADLVRGPNLRTYLDAAGTLAPAEAAAVAVQVLHGLAAAHALGVVHRDVKPENVLMDTSGPTPVAKLTDFGVARLAQGPSSGRMTALVGTVAYLAPELAEDSRATPPSDIWSTGILLYELLCGTTPFSVGSGGNLIGMIKAAAEREPAPLPGVPADLWIAIASMLAKAPDQRPAAASAAGGLDELLPSLAGIAALPRLAAPPGVPPHPYRTVVLPRSATEAPAPPQPVAPPARAPAPATAPAWRRPPVWLLGAVGGAVLVVALVAGGLALAGRRPATVSQSFPPVLVGATVSSQRVWHLSGDRLTAEVSLRNVGSSPADVTYDEVVPETAAPKSGDLRQVAPGGYQVVKADPVLRWAFAQMPPGSVQTLTYQATTKSQPNAGSPRGRLAALVADQQREEALYAAQARISIRVLHALVVVPPVVTMAPGGTVPLAVAGTFDDGTVAPAEAFKPTFVSSNPAAAVVDDHGTIKATGTGGAVVRASVGSVWTDVPVSVVAASPSPRPLPAASPPTPKPAPPPTGPATPSPQPTTPSAPVLLLPGVPHGPDDYGSGPAVAVKPDGTQATLWKGTDGDLWAAVWDGKAWSGPTRLGMGPMASEPAVGVDGSGHGWAYWKGPDGLLREAFSDGTKWNGPIVLSQFGAVASEPAVAIAPSGHQYLSWKGADGHLLLVHWTGSAWEGPTELGMGPLNSHPAAALDAAEHPYVYWKGTDGNLWQAFYDGARWTGPKSLGMGTLGSAPAVAVASSGAQSVYWKGTDGNLWAGVWTGQAASPWVGPLKVLGASMAAGPTIGLDAAGHAWVYWKGTDTVAWGAYFDTKTWIGPVTIPQMGPFG
ncbi:MAG: serine/threonine protein kinase [Actinobacteria bacterium]|nr:serine/threonine protein kinase [Actinomycetota bacterium]